MPVFLPSYEFEISGGPEQSVIQTRGTWIAERGIPEPLQTTTIECRKSTMRCAESAAYIVFVEGKGLMESRRDEFEVDRWSDKEIVTKPNAGRCVTEVLSLDLAARRATRRTWPSPEQKRCKETPNRTLELVAGYKARAEALEEKR